MPATSRGVYHNLKESRIVASNGEVTFHFSSYVYRDKFLQTLQQNRERIKRKLAYEITNHYLNVDILADITHYVKTEKRGYYATVKSVNNNKIKMPISKQDLHNYALRKMMSKDVIEWV